MGIHNTENEERKTFRKALIIGLGGSGQKVLVNLKRMFIDECGMVPPCIKFLELDTSNAKETVYSLKTGDQVSLKPDEFIYLEETNPVTFIKSSKNVQEWYIKPMPVGAIHAGTGAIRQNGRLAFWKHIPDINTKIDKLLTDLNHVTLEEEMEKAGFNLSKRHPEIIITGSIAGGTGSGTFIDMGILCRKKTKDQQTIITGIFLLPWIYRHKPATFRTPANAYAALTEIDALMSPVLGGSKDKRFKVNYGGGIGTIELNEPPYTLIHLIDGRNANGENVSDADALASSIAHSIALNLGAIGEKAGDHIDNILTSFNYKTTGTWDGKNPRYTSFGVSSLVYPAREYHSVRSYEEAEELIEAAMRDCSDISSGGASSKEIDDQVLTFARENNLASENLNSLLERIISIENLDTSFEFEENFSYRDRNIINSITDLKKMHLDTMRSQVSAQIDTKVPRLKEDLCQKIEETIKRLQAEEIQGGLSRNFALSWSGTLKAIIEENREAVAKEISTCDHNLKQIRDNEGFHLDNIGSSSHIIFNSQRKAACAKYASVISQEASLIARRTCLEQAVQIFEAVLNTIRMKLDEMRGVAAGANEVVIRLSNIKSEFIKKKQTLIAEDRHRRKNPFEIFVGELKTIYYPDGHKPPEITYEKFKKDQKITSSALYNGKSEQELKDLFLTYTKDQLKEILSVTIEQVLDRVEKDHPEYTEGCFRDLLRLSCPLWRYNRGYITAERAKQMCTVVVCGVYKDSAIQTFTPPIKAHQQAFNIKDDPSFVSTGDPYKVHMLQYESSLPAYILEDMDKYRREYEAVLMPTTHIDKYFQFDVPDLFPEKSLANKALRIITLAIIPGIDVIKDEKLTKGHQYTIDYLALNKELKDEYENYKQLNDEYDPLILYTFIELYEYVISNEKVAKVLLNKIVQKCESMAPETLKTELEKHLQELEARFKSQDFTKQITGRFYSRELKILKGLLMHLSRGKKVQDFLTC